LTELRTAGQSRVVMAAVHGTLRTSANSQCDRGALVEERREAAIVGRRSRNSEPVRAHPYERDFRLKPDSQQDYDIASKSLDVGLDT
jgi:hypothetical protein